MNDNVEKREVEELLGCTITDEQFEEALKYARHKQAYIYQREPRKVVMQHWYLVKLTEEYVRSLAFSKFTMDLCRTLRDMEKEHPITDRSAPTDIHIVAVPGIWSSRLMKPLRKSSRHPAGEVPAGTQRGRRQGTGVNSAGQKLTTEFMAIQ